MATNKPYWWVPTQPEEWDALYAYEIGNSPPSWWSPPVDDPYIDTSGDLTRARWLVPTEPDPQNALNIVPLNMANKDSAIPSMVYTSYAGVDITASIVMPGESTPLDLGELQTISYSMHRENTPVRTLGHANPRGFVKGPRTLAGSLIFTQFDLYTFYRLKEFRNHLDNNLFPLADMLPPFDVVISFSNEVGAFSKMKIYGITIVDEGGTMSIDDLISETTYTYMARGIQPIVNYIPSDAGNATSDQRVLRRKLLNINF